MTWLRWLMEAIARAFAFIRSQRDIELGERRERDRMDLEEDRAVSRADRARSMADRMPIDTDPDNRDRL